MEFGCPLCNGLTELELVCPDCAGKMDDEGPLDNFFGPYSPYEEHDLYHMVLDDEHSWRCIHLVRCTQCGEDFRVGIQRIRM